MGETWVFIVTRNNSVETVRVFNSYNEGCIYTNNFINRIEPGLDMMPNYEANECYKNDDLNIGLYKSI